MDLFFGEHAKRIDKKGRVSVPSDFRTALAEAQADAVIVLPEPKQPFLRGMPPAEFQDILRQLRVAHGRFSAQRTAASRKLFSKALKLQFDGEGRIILPKHFLDYAQIDGELVFAGAGDHFQIWQPDQLAAHDRDDAAMADDTIEALEALPPEGLGL